jgi:transcriptional regulator of acetoin/glycerol metabolism
MVISTRGARLTVADLPSDIREPAPGTTGSSSTSTSGTVRSIEEAEREAIVEALRHVGGNVTEAARRLGIGRATLYRKLTRYEIERSSF